MFQILGFAQEFINWVFAEHDSLIKDTGARLGKDESQPGRGFGLHNPFSTTADHVTLRHVYNKTEVAQSQTITVDA